MLSASLALKVSRKLRPKSGAPQAQEDSASLDPVLPMVVCLQLCYNSTNTVCACRKQLQTPPVPQATNATCTKSRRTAGGVLAHSRACRAG